MANWKDRLQQAIVLVSPAGEEFIAYWKGDSRSVSKKLGVFDYPFYPGSMIQDLDVTADNYPITFFFEGPDHDLQAERFYEACRLRGVWTVNHPTKGVKTLQLVSVSEEIDPVENANISALKTEWLEPMGDHVVTSISQLGAEAKATAAVVMEKSADQFVEGVGIEKPSTLAKFKARLSAATDKIKAVLSTVTQTVAEVNAAVESVHRGIQTGLEAATLSVMALAGQVQTLIDLPGQIRTDLDVRLDYYTNLIEDALGLSDNNVNDTVIKELIATTASVSINKAIIDSDLTTKEEALSLIDTVTSTFNTITTTLDAGQSQWVGNEVESRYFSQSGAYTDLVKLNAQMVDLLLRRAFDLAVAKRFILKTNRCPVEIALTEGVDLDVFISSNRLKGNDILLLPAGREVVVYL